MLYTAWGHIAAHYKSWDYIAVRDPGCGHVARGRLSAQLVRMRYAALWTC